MTTLSILIRTFPYILMRLVAQVALTLIALIITVCMAAVIYGAVVLLKAAWWVIIALGLATLGILWGFRRLAERYILYLIKAGHVAVITELAQRGGLPPGINQIAYGKDMVLQRFGSVTVLAAVDVLVEGAVRQILRWLTGAVQRLTFIPGLGLLWAMVRQTLSIASNYIDEAVFSYILTHRDQNVWQAAADGVTLYAQGWRRILGTAFLVVMVVIGGWLLIFLLTLFPLLGLAELITEAKGIAFILPFFALLAAVLVANGVRAALVDPFATVAMIVAYSRVMQEEVPRRDMYGTLADVSQKFRLLTRRAQEAAS